MIDRLSYVSCDVCRGNPAQPGDDARDARAIASHEGYRRERRDGKMVDVCHDCRHSSPVKTCHQCKRLGRAPW